MAACGLGNSFKMNEASACFFECEAGARLSHEQGACKDAEMRLMAYTHHHGVS
jgi:hypothetical protein